MPKQQHDDIGVNNMELDTDMTFTEHVTTVQLTLLNVALNRGLKNRNVVFKNLFIFVPIPVHGRTR